MQHMSNHENTTVVGPFHITRPSMLRAKWTPRFPAVEFESHSVQHLTERMNMIVLCCVYTEPADMFNPEHDYYKEIHQSQIY